jgi:hypothetical protein
MLNKEGDGDNTASVSFLNTRVFQLSEDSASLRKEFSHRISQINAEKNLFL